MYYQVTNDPKNIFPDWDHLFSNYNVNWSFDSAVSNPQLMFRGNRKPLHRCLGTRESTMIGLQDDCNVAVVGMITCTALIARCGVQSEIYVCHVNAGYIDSQISDTLRQLKNPNHMPQAIYVLPSSEYLDTYREDVNQLIQLGYQTCIVAPMPEEKISTVVVNRSELYVI